MQFAFLSKPLAVARSLPQRAAGLLRKLRPAQRIWIGAGALLVLFFIWMAWPRPQEVEVAAVDRGAVRHEVVDEGRTRIHDVYVVAAPVGGALQRIALEPGDEVAKNQIVGTILPADPALLDARVEAEARAAVATADSLLKVALSERDSAQRDQGRIAQLAKKGFASPAALDAVNSALATARANVAARRAELQRARVAAGAAPERARAPTPVRSPIAGKVLRLFQESAAVIGAGSPLMEVGDLAELEVVAEFLSQDAVLMRPGARAYIEAWGGETAIPARVSRIEPYAHTKISALGVEEQRVNVIVRLEQPDKAPPLGHGFRVDVRVVMAEASNVLRVPTDALVRDGAKWAVFRIEDGRARLTPVQIGDGGDHFRILSQGLAEGDRVILFPGDSLRDGARVKAAARD